MFLYQALENGVSMWPKLCAGDGALGVTTSAIWVDSVGSTWKIWVLILDVKAIQEALRDCDTRSA